MEYKTIGVLGGMGPEASANFYQEVLHCCQEKYHAEQDTDYPPMIIYSLPLLGFDQTGVVDEKLVLKQLVHGVRTLERAGCDFIVIPCNTVHCFIKEIRNSVTIPIISIMEETVKRIAKDKITCVGLLGAQTTLKLQLYQKLLDVQGVDYVLPMQKEGEFITNLILEVMGGKIKNETKNKVLSIMSRMQSLGVEGAVLGCTEIPLAISQKDVSIKVYDTLQVLAEAAVDHAAKKISILPIMMLHLRDVSSTSLP